MFDWTLPPIVRVLRIIKIERPSSRACAMATKLYWPPTPLSTRPSSSMSEATAPLRVAMRPELVHESRVLPLRSFELLVTVQLIHERDTGHAELLALRTIHSTERIVEASRSKKEAGVGDNSALELLPQTVLEDFARRSSIREIRNDELITDPDGSIAVNKVRPEHAERLK